MCAQDDSKAEEVSRRAVLLCYLPLSLLTKADTFQMHLFLVPESLSTVSEFNRTVSFSFSLRVPPFAHSSLFWSSQTALKLESTLLRLISTGTLTS